LYLERTGGFREITTKEAWVPLGPWAGIDGPLELELGNIMQKSLLCYMDSVRPILIEAGHAQNELDRLYEAIGGEGGELATKEGLAGSIHAVYAERL